MVMVAVAVPVSPTSLPAMSFTTISSSYCVVGRVCGHIRTWLGTVSRASGQREYSRDKSVSGLIEEQVIAPRLL